ncbi:hypothetical protein [Flavobacterium columnare]|uniref:Lipoprotein n=1 Tax=Flavobacterium columnare TaxID=996 RepID=A0AAI8CFQ1_9FLAO|nr:hypothetical protein [Flavobacterium columnare]AMO19310.1 hypothetical protein UN65_02070 [Flavobacterium columnare]AUX17245.1 hypothetical protein AQ623_02145 [Flavobacterium columnare]QOG56256.1 hypothetical protein HUE29_02095 [Flavobacterium columnare]QOG58979.1 hypothetical protein HUE30_02095 [Flavobacterium columnare]QOG61701.1 hypothetical protein HUE31_02100 [Flavobacterium columnare]
MKKIVLFITLFTVLISCKKEAKQNNVLDQKTSTESIKLVDKNENKKISSDCEQLVHYIISSTNLIKDYENYFTRIENNDGKKIKIQVYTENNLSEDPRNKQIVESTIAWLELFPQDKKLKNISSDPENPTEVKFDYYLLNDNFFETCKIEQKANNKISPEGAILPFDYSDYYKKCIFEPEDNYCQEHFQVEMLNSNETLLKILTTNKYKLPSSYSYLTKINEIQPIILYFDESDDLSTIDLITIKENKIISSLKISSNENNMLLDFIIQKDYSIELFKHKNLLEKRILFKKYKIDSNGVIGVK